MLCLGPFWITVYINFKTLPYSFGHILLINIHSKWMYSSFTSEPHSQAFVLCSLLPIFLLQSHLATDIHTHKFRQHGIYLRLMGHSLGFYKLVSLAPYFTYVSSQLAETHLVCLKQGEEVMSLVIAEPTLVTAWASKNSSRMPFSLPIFCLLFSMVCIFILRFHVVTR